MHSVGTRVSFRVTTHYVFTAICGKQSQPNVELAPNIEKEKSSDTPKVLPDTPPFEIESGVGNKDYSVLAAKVLAGATDYGGKTVLICWHHENIPELAQGLRAANAPANWMDEVFDRIWVLEYESSGEVYFQDLAQDLLQGDSKS